MKDKIISICGYAWNKVVDGNLTYYFMDGYLDKCEFGKTNNYTDSNVRNMITNSDLAKNLQLEFGDRLVPITLDLLSLDGLDDYGTVTGDILAIPTIDLYRKYRKNISKLDSWYWLATPDSTPSGYGSGGVRFVSSDGGVGYGWCSRVGAVRPFWEGRCNKVGETLKLESLHQKNRQPFFLNKKDKYKGLKYYNRR